MLYCFTGVFEKRTSTVNNIFIPFVRISVFPFFFKICAYIFLYWEGVGGTESVTENTEFHYRASISIHFWSRSLSGDALETIPGRASRKP